MILHKPKEKDIRPADDLAHGFDKNHISLIFRNFE